MRRPRARSRKTRKQKEDPDPDDPALNGGQTPGATPPPQQSAADIILDSEADVVSMLNDNFINDLRTRDPQTAAYLIRLRDENKKTRLKLHQHKEENERLNAEHAKLSSKVQTEEEKKLAEQNQWKDVANLRESSALVLRDRLINAELKAELASEGIKGDQVDIALKLIDRNGIVAGADGAVSGIKSAVTRFKDTHATLLPALSGAPAPAAAAAALPTMPGAPAPVDPTDPNDPYWVWMRRAYGPGAAMMADQMRKMSAGAGDLPAAAPTNGSKVKDLRKSAGATKEDADKFWQDNILAKDKKR